MVSAGNVVLLELNVCTEDQKFRPRRVGRNPVLAAVRASSKDNAALLRAASIVKLHDPGTAGVDLAMLGENDSAVHGSRRDLE